MIVHIFLVIYVFIRQTELVNSQKPDKLDFWDPGGKSEARRVNADRVYRHHPNQDSTGHFRYGKGKTKAPRQTRKIPVIKNKTDKLKPIDRVRSRSIVRELVEETTKSWPKLQQRRYKKQNRKEALRSTRMTPLYLMQKSAEKDETTTEKKLLDEEQEVDEPLSPFSIKQQMIEFASKAHEANITVEVIGRTVEYNDIVMLKITERKSEIGKYFRADESKYVDEVPEKKIIFIVHGLSVMGIHDLPCLSNMVQFKVLMSYYYAHLDKFDIFLIPMANPDGVASKRYIWNKNMSPQDACPGVSLDRNFDVAWNASAYTSSCSHHFPGLAPFSEPETRAIREVLHHYGHRINGYFHVHSGTHVPQTFKGDAVLYPKGYTDVQTDDDKYMDLRGEIDEALRNASFQVISVTVDTIYNWYGKVFGSSVDYASTVYGIPYSMELVMQLYNDERPENLISYDALKEIWKRVLDVIFNNIWRNTRSGDT